MRSIQYAVMTVLTLAIFGTRALAGLEPWPAWEGFNDREDREGWCVGTAGDVNADGYSDVLVTAPSWYSGEPEEGGAFVYHGSADGLGAAPSWTGQPNQEGAQYGVHGDAAGDVNGDGYGDIIVGAWGYDGGQDGEGRAFVYHGSPTGLSPTPAWFGECNQAGARFGHCVAPAGDVNADGYDDVLVGAYSYDNGQSDEGAAFLYLGSASGLASTHNWKYEGNQTSANAGHSVCAAGDVNGDGYDDVLIGASGYDAGQSNEGRAYLFYGSASGLGATPVWTGEGNQDGAHYGEAVALAGDVNGDGYGDFLIGAQAYDFGATDAGRVWIYLGSASGPQAGIGFGAPAPSLNGSFGTALRTLGDVNADGFADVIVGASHYSGGNGEEGGAWAYWGGRSGLETTPDWHVEGEQNGAHLGWSVSGAGDVNGDGCSDAIVGIPDLTIDWFSAGAAWVFHGNPGGLNETARLEPHGVQAGAYLGYSVAYAGDVNGDGYGDIIAGAYGYDGPLSDEGRIYIYHGERHGLPYQGAVREIDRASSLFGLSVARAGDVNGDGYDDVVVGAPRYDLGQDDEGAAFVYHGSPSGISASYDWHAESNQSNAYYGWSVAGAGDVNGDGYADVLVGAQSYTDDLLYQGAAFLYLGSEFGLSSTPAWSVEGHHENALLGTAVAGAGDLNGDGYSDVAVILYNYAPGNITEGAAQVYYGSPAGPSASPDWTWVCNQANARMHAIGAAGDINGDGYGDLLVGAPRYDGSLLDEGRAWCFHGSMSGLSSVPNWTRDGGEFAGNFGASVAGAGDVNGDGFADVLVGAPRYTDNISLEGAAFAYYGWSEGLGGADWGDSGQQADSRFGICVSSAGDVNGDGFSDITVGADSWDEGNSNEGQVRLYLGNLDAPEGGLDVLARQQATDGSPIAWLGLADAPDRFELRAQARSPLGRGLVRMEYQVAELGDPLSTAPLEIGDWYDTGAPVADVGSAADVMELAAGLQAESVHHWRFRIRTTSIYAPASRWYTQSPATPTVAHFRTGGGTSDVDGDRAVDVHGARIESLSPNPSPGTTRIVFVTPQSGSSEAANSLPAPRITVHDAVGRRIAVLSNDGGSEAGRQVTQWDGRDARGKQVEAGVYFVRLATPEGGHAKKLLIVK